MAILKSITLPSVVCALVVAVSVDCSGQGQISGGGSGVRGDVVGRYIRAIQNQDFKTVVDLSAASQAAVTAIKARNPKVLWDKLVGEYYQQESATLSATISEREAEPTFSWAAYAEALLPSNSGAPTQIIRALRGFLPGSSKWAVSETRPLPGGETVYVTVTYPAIGDAPILGSQLLKQTILQFSIDSPNRLVAAVQKVPQADVYWPSSLDVRTVMAKRFFTAGQVDAAIAQLELVRSENKLSAENQILLASAYFQHVTRQCFEERVSSNTSKRLLRFRGEDNLCTTDIRQAIALNPGLKRDWIAQLRASAAFDLEASEPELAAPMLKMAAQFAAGDPEVESLIALSSKAVGEFYMARAESHIKDLHWHFQDKNVVDDLEKAIELLPDEARRRGFEMAREHLQSYVKDSGFGAAFEILGIMKKLGLRIPAPEVPRLLGLGQTIPTNLPTVFGFQRIDARSEWEKRVRELAAP